jgi:hypothetical protein
VNVRTGALWAVGLLLASTLTVAGVVTWNKTGSSTRSTPTTATGSPGPTGSLPASAAPGTPASKGLHYISNTKGDRTAAAKLGYNLFDMGPTKELIDALAPGQQALVWLGNLDNTSCTPGYTWSQFTAAVDRLAGDRKVFGYFLSDEPHPYYCPDALTHIRERADYIRARDPVQKSFIVVLDSGKQCNSVPGCEYEAFRPENSHVDLFGIDPFICNVNTGCTFERIERTVGLAESKGIPRKAMVPVYQAFGQKCNTEQEHYYSLPTVDQMQQMLKLWSSSVPNAVFDSTYTWMSQGPACPALDVANGNNGNADLQSVMRAHNTG